MARPLCSLDGKKKHGNSQKSNDRILLVYLIVLTIDGNYGLQRGILYLELFLLSVFLPNQDFSHLKNISTLEKYQRDWHLCFDLNT